MKKTMHFLLLFATIGAFTWLGCGSKKTEAPTTLAVDNTDLITVRTAPIKQGTMAQELHATGMLGSKSEARLAFKTGGIIAKIYVKEGDFVKAGQLLATLNLTEINAQVAQSKLGLEKAERDLQRAKNLYADTVTTLETVQNASTGADLARKNVEIAQFNQLYSEIRAPRAGKVIKKIMSEGELAGPGMPVLFINESGANDWVVRTGVSDVDWASLSVGNTASVHLDAYPGESFPGKITKLADAADPMSGTYEVEITVQSKGKRFAYGLFAKVAIQPQKAGTWAMVPIEAIIEGNGTEGFVFVPNADRKSVQKIPVKIAKIYGKEIGIAGGLSGQTEVITTGAAFLTENSTIKILE